MSQIKFLKPLKLYFILLAMILLATGADNVISSAKSSMVVCFSTVIPSLFPFMVLSGAFVSSITPGSFKNIGIVTNALFGIRAPANAAFIPGIVCGYPIGAKCAAELYMSGKVSKSEAESIIAYSNNSGPLFVIGAVGTGMLGSAKLGIILYATQIVCALVAAVILKHFTEYPVCESKNTKKTSADFAANVCSSVTNVVNVCGFIVFFAVVSSLLSPLFEILPPFARGLATSLLEITNGINEITANSYTTTLKLSMISFALGWSGLSVHLQVKSILTGTGLCMKKYYITRFLIGVFSSLITYFLLSNADLAALVIYKNKGLVFALLFALCALVIFCTKKGTAKKSLLCANPKYIR